MAFRIGSPFSPAVTAALLRRGEGGGGTRIARQDPIRRYGQPEGPDEGPSELELMREERLSRAMDMEQSRRKREEEFGREAFDYKKEQDRLNRDRQQNLDDLAAENAGKPDPKEMRAIRDSARKLILDITKVMNAATEIDPATGKVNPQRAAQAQQMAALLWQQYLALGLPQQEIEEAARMLGIGPTGAASRAGGDITGKLDNADPRGGQGPPAHDGAKTRMGGFAANRDAVLSGRSPGGRLQPGGGTFGMAEQIQSSMGRFGEKPLGESPMFVMDR